jgi:D-alanyl-lipoteichoic acid acyltransferase DltB (MBOAT superfamily)
LFWNPGLYGRGTLVLGVLAYTVQIWGDFSGYTDMGRGAARMLGIVLPENFLSPYLARTPSEFWRRWHVSLSEWIRDYIYIPLGGSRGSKARVFVVALLTMIISGLWHGAAVTFLLWGAYHGALLILERILKSTALNRAYEERLPLLLRNGLEGIAMFSAASLGWLIFRNQGMRKLMNYLRALATDSGSQPFTGSSEVLLALALCLLIQAAAYYSFESRKFVFLGQRPASRRLGVLAVVLACVMTLALFFRSASSGSQFIYFQF